MTTITFIRSDGVKLVADGTSARNGIDWGITGMEGFDSPSISLYSDQNGYGHGSFYSGFAYVDRDIKITAEAKVNDNGLRGRALSFFNTSKSIKVVVTYRKVTRWITGRVSARSIPSTNIHEKPTFTITITCMDPFFKSENRVVSTFISTSSFFHFPYTNKLTTQAPIASISREASILVENNGDEEVYPIIEVTILDRTKFSLTLTNSNGNFNFGTSTTYQEGDEIFIDFENAIFTKNGVNAFSTLTGDTSFRDFKFTTGDNVLKIGSASSSAVIPRNIETSIKFYKNYLGV